MNAFLRPWPRLALGIAFSTLMQVSARAQTPPVSNDAAKAVLRDYVNSQVKPYWLDQKALLAKTLATPPSEQYQSIWRDLDGAEQSLPTKDLLVKTMQGATLHERNANMIWLRSRILNGNADVRYSYIYALLLSISSESSGAPMLQQAAAFLLQGRIALAIDGARCADRASPSVARQDMDKLPELAVITRYMASAPPADLGNALSSAVAIEQLRGPRPPQAWLCSLGAATALKALRNPDLVRKDGAGIVIDTSTSVPDYVTEEVWLQRKDAILDGQIQAMTRYLR